MSDHTLTARRGQSYKRGYVACVGCRTRKVRCVLTGKPPCAKCLREHRECRFQSTGKTTKRREPPSWTQSRGRSACLTAPEDHASRSQALTSEIRNNDSPQGPVSDAGRVDVAQCVDQNPEDGYSSCISDRMMSTILARPRDALDVLFDAAQSRADAPSFPEGAQKEPTDSRSGDGSLSGIVSASGLVSVSGLSQPAEEVLDLWDKCRFVRQGWFTAQEAVTYLDLFYRYLAPLSPVLTNRYRNHSHHDQLIREEPMLCCTLLMISSRYFILPGAGGVSRSHFIHNRLWQYCELLIHRIMLGQEKYSTAKTRVVGSIESLILISDWHPRSVHFPPDTEGWDGELISPDYDRRNRLHTNNDVPLIRWREDVFEPAKRSERISWMLLGAAVSLAYELGVFVESGSPAALSATEDPEPAARMYRARNLLHIYVTQMAVKIGCASFIPENISFGVPSLGMGPIHVNREWDVYMSLWMELTRLMKTASALFFQSMSHVKQQLLNGTYHVVLQHFAPSLQQWYEKFSSASSGIPESLKPLILIDYHYLKTYTSSLAIQAVVERATMRRGTQMSEPAGEGLAGCILPQDQRFIRDVICDSGEVLALATAMGHRGTLRYAPLRTLVSVTSSSVFLLKAISLGARNADLQSSLATLDRSIAALRASGTDDMDFSLRYATLIEKHVARFRQQFLPPRPPAHPRSSDDAYQGPLASGNVGNAVDSGVRLSRPSSPGAPQYPLFSLGVDNTHMRGDNAGPLDASFPEDDWWARPFDPNIAPFSSNSDGISLGLELDSLDFLWNLPSVGG